MGARSAADSFIHEQAGREAGRLLGVKLTDEPLVPAATALRVPLANQPGSADAGPDEERALWLQWPCLRLLLCTTALRFY